MSMKRIIVVGASSGIGAAIAAEYSARGARVALVARREEELKARCEELGAPITDPNQMPIFRAHDVSGDDVQEVYNEVVASLGGIDVLVYAAGVMPETAPDEFNSSKDRQTVLVNTVGAMQWLNCAATDFQERGSGALVAISSVAGDRGRTGRPAYCASKAGLNSFMESLRNRLVGKGVTVLTVKPGFVRTSMSEGIQGGALLPVVAPEVVAKAVYNGVQKRKNTIYVPGRWRLVMWIIRMIPGFIFRRTTI
ncbi:MAG: short-chain dehydrogenase [Myxococcales bacterium]|nr:short-chain dehydrogenase [Myxococcales bacterium]